MSDFVARLHAAVLVLVGDGPVKHRLCQAYAEHLEDLDSGNVPGPFRPAFDELRAALQRVPPAGKESRVKASVQKMSPAEAALHASHIVHLYAQVGQFAERAEPLKVVSTTPARAPRYLSATNN
jgi:hypothetical protein